MKSLILTAVALASMSGVASAQSAASGQRVSIQERDRLRAAAQESRVNCIKKWHAERKLSKKPMKPGESPARACAGNVTPAKFAPGAKTPEWAKNK